MADGGRKHRPPILPSPRHEGVSVNKQQIRKAGVCMRPDYHNPNLLVRILGRVNEFEIEIDRKIGTALIDRGEMISMMSKEYCEEQGYEIQTLDLHNYSLSSMSAISSG